VPSQAGKACMRLQDRSSVLFNEVLGRVGVHMHMYTGE
jgi:hypothetical protein